MHTLFNNIYDASNTAESDYTAVIPDLTDHFFHWKVEVDLSAAQPWITAVVESIFAFIPPARLAALAPKLLTKTAPGLIDTTKNFAGAGTLLIGGSGTEISIIEKKMGTIQELGDLIKAATQDVRDGVDDWSAQLFSGDPDVTGLSIIDYLKGGRFMLPFMSASDMSEYMFQVRVAWLANRQWLKGASQHSKKFVMCANATDVPCNDDTRFSDGNRTCCLYQITGKAQYEESKDLATLRSSTYNFNISKITEASVRSWISKGFDTGERNATEIIMSSLSVDESQFFTHGIGAEGIFTLPVCDVGNASWVAKWTDKPNMLPCCCGPYCKDTKAFYQASSMWRKDEAKDSTFKKKLDGRCVKQYSEYIADWSKAAVVKTPRFTFIASCFVLVAGIMIGL
ncbi:hypothetical protein BDV96DRAFT_577714 [Lophiotrema nucula]|uniref:Uncharacterized protein n=1 Tax=Lophiotrema nucula TaxID=690887 RepID=A0A6A5Z580_9PLEO|nr:hypothetical protein BDV96DRAFT_577714 [Lophiotrema nucula]